jgi:uncharacterized RDD family membrane protein YckC
VTFEDRIRIETPEGVDLELTLAGLGSRVGAGTIDLLIKLAADMVLLLLFAVVLSQTSGALAATGIGVLVFAAFLVEFGYDVAFEVLGGGRTIGKRSLGTRVMRKGGAPVDFRSSVVRNLLRLVDGPLTGYMLGVVMVLVSKSNQRLGDIVAGTIVVRDRAPAALPTDVEYHYASGDPMPWDVGRVDREVLAMLRGFLMRRETLDPAMRARLATQLYARVRPMVGGVAENLGPEPFIEEVVRLKSQ